MNAFKEKTSETDIRDAIGQPKTGNTEAISERRKELIRGYAQLPGGPLSIRIVDEKALQEFLNNAVNRVKVTRTLEKLKEMTDEYGEIPLKWYFNLAAGCEVTQSTANQLRLECQHLGISTTKAFLPKNETELNFFIGELAYHSHLFKEYNIRPFFTKGIFSIMKNSELSKYLKDLHEWYNKEGKNLARMGFTGDERGLLLGCGLTADWMKNLELSKDDALFLAEHHPTSWRESDALSEMKWRRMGQPR